MPGRRNTIDKLACSASDFSKIINGDRELFLKLLADSGEVILYTVLENDRDDVFTSISRIPIANSEVGKGDNEKPVRRAYSSCNVGVKGLFSAKALEGFSDKVELNMNFNYDSVAKRLNQQYVINELSIRGIHTLSLGLAEILKSYTSHIPANGEGASVNIIAVTVKKHK